jgi:hypothetical protein
MDWKRKIAVILVVTMSLAIPAKAQANSAPVYMERYPTFRITPMEDCPIRVDREKLTFKVDECLPSDAMVVAEYVMTNTSENSISVPMIFPFVSEGHVQLLVGIEFDGAPVEYALYGVDYVDISGYFENPESFREKVHINSIIDNLNSPPYEARHFNDDTVLYTVTFGQPTDRQSRVSFTADFEKTRILTFGGLYDGFEINRDGECTVSLYVNDRNVGKQSYILVMGEDTLKDIRIDGNDTLEKSIVNIKDFILNKGVNSEYYSGYDMEYRDVENLYAMVVQEIDRFFEQQEPVFDYDLVLGEMFRNNVTVLLYEVEFAAGSTNSLTITFPVTATTDRRNSKDYINTFVYLLNPAEKFLDFKGIDIYIELNSHAPYIIESSIPLNEMSFGVYSVSLDGLPGEDLVFSTYPNREITPVDDSTLAKFLPLGYKVFLFFILLAAVVFLAITKKRNRQRG